MYKVSTSVLSIQLTTSICTYEKWFPFNTQVYTKNIDQVRFLVHLVLQELWPFCMEIGEFVMVAEYMDTFLV